MEKYLNTNLPPEERADDLLSKMSIEEKMAQVVCLFPWGQPMDELMEDYPVGAGHVSALNVRDLKTLEEAVEWQIKYQKEIMSRSEHHIPAIFHMEGLCGAFLQGAASFPSGYGRAASWDPELEEEIGKIVSRQERCVGISQTFAPVLDISRDQRMGRCGETYGEDPTLAAAMGSAYTKGLQSEETEGLRTEGVAKHFLGFHASYGGIHGTDCQISDRELREVYAKPFQASITEAGLRGVMPCYNAVNGVPASVSKHILTDLLRNEMGFDGIAVSDYCAISNVHDLQHLFESDAESGLASMSAGMDSELQNKMCFNNELMEWFESGKADISVLNQAVKRILETKFRMGLFEHPFALDKEVIQKHFIRGNEEEVSLQSARESLVLLKNDGTLPVSKKVKKIAVIGEQANDARILFGGYTHFSMAEGDLAAVKTMAGVQTGKDEEIVSIETIPGTNIQKSNTPEFMNILKHQKPECKSILEVLKDALPDTEIIYAYGYDFSGNDMSHYNEALEAAKAADIVIVTLGGKHGTSTIASMGEGMDAANINLPICQEKFLRKLGKLQKSVIGVHIDGRPLTSDAADEVCNAIIEAWNPAEMGGKAIVEAILGEYNPGGKLPVTVAYHAGQIPIYYNHPNNSSYHQGGSIAFADYVDCPHHPRYYFGHGLSYTSFEYKNIALSKKQVGREEHLQVSFDLKNTGNCYGDEVVQLYVRDMYATCIRPVQELEGFARVGLNQGETKHITFDIKPGQLAFLDINMKWKVEKGAMEVRLGSSSEDIRLTDTFDISESYYVDGRSRGFYADVEIV